jgi:hypothetical protein
VAQAEVLLHPRTAQIEVAILEPQILVDGFVGVDLEWRNQGAIEDFEFLDRYFDVARCEPWILRPGRPRANHTADAQDVFVAQVLRFAKAGVLGIKDDLGYAFVIAEIDEDQTPMIATPIDPSAEVDEFARVGGAQGAA